MGGEFLFLGYSWIPNFTDRVRAICCARGSFAASFAACHVWGVSGSPVDTSTVALRPRWILIPPSTQPIVSKCLLCAQPIPCYQGSKEDWDIAPVLRKLSCAVDPANAAALLGHVRLSAGASGTQIHWDASRFQQGHANPWSVIFYLPLQTQHCKVALGGDSQEDLTQPLFLFSNYFMVWIHRSSWSFHWNVSAYQFSQTVRILTESNIELTF